MNEIFLINIIGYPIIRIAISQFKAEFLSYFYQDRGKLYSIINGKRYYFKKIKSVTWLDKCHVFRYTFPVIKTFIDKHTQELYETGKSKRFSPDILKRALRRLEYIDLATGLDDLRVPPSNRLHELEQDRKGQHSISVNDRWRICFCFIDGDAYDVELTDYH